MSVFGLHFTNVLNNHRPVDYSVLDLLEQKPCMTSIDNPITFSEFKKAINKLKKGSCLVLTGSPLKPSKQRTTPHEEWSTATFASSMKERLTMKGGTKANVSPCQRKAT